MNKAQLIDALNNIETQVNALSTSPTPEQLTALRQSVANAKGFGNAADTDPAEGGEAVGDDDNTASTEA